MAVTYSELLKQEVKFPVMGERQFYSVYLELSNQTKDEDKKLAGMEIQLLALLMSKDLNFTLMFNQKSKKGGMTINQQIAKQMNTSVNYILLMTKNLRKNGTLIVKDNIVEFNAELQQLRIATKNRIKDFTAMPFEFTYSFKVVEDDNEEEGDSSDKE